MTDRERERELWLFLIKRRHVLGWDSLRSESIGAVLWILNKTGVQSATSLVALLIINILAFFSVVISAFD